MSAKAFNRRGHSVLAMITSAAHQSWPGDSAITDLKSAGLKASSLVRLKLFTLDNRFIVRQAGMLSAADRASVGAQLRTVLTALG